MRKLLCILLVVSCFGATAQRKSKTTATTTQKKPLTHDVYDGWKEIPYKQLTNDGAYAGFLINPQEGDGKLVIYDFKSTSEDSVARASDVRLTWDNKYAVFKIKPPVKLVKDLRRQKKKKDELPKDSLGIYTLATAKLEKIPAVNSFKVPEKIGGWIAYQLDVVKESKADAKKDAKADSTKALVKPKKKVKKNSDDNGFTLVLRNTTSGKETQFGFVKDYLFGEYGHGLMFTSTGNDSTLAPGVYWYDLKEEKLTQLMTGKDKQKFKQLAISEDGLHAAFIADLDTTKALVRYPKLYHWKKGQPQAMLIADESAGLLVKDWTLSEHFTPEFSRDGSKLFFGAAPIPAVKDTTLLPEEIVNVEVWTGDDDYIYPQQNSRLESERKRSYLSVIDLATSKVTALADEDLPGIELGDEGNAPVALGESDVKYRKMTTWDISAYNDLYVVNVQDGSHKAIAEKVKGRASLSPKASYAFWFSLPDTAWFSYSIGNGKVENLSHKLAVSFADEEDDHPDYPSPYGYAGWTEGDKLLLVYDRFDIWALDPANQHDPVNLTKIGRQSKIEFRYVRLDPDERFIDSNKDMLLVAFDDNTKQSGYYKLSLKDNKLTKLVMGDYRYGRIEKARAADRVIFTRENFQEYPDVWASGMTFSSPRKITNANPQMKNYLWGSVDPVQWVSLDGVPLHGLLYKPENFDPKKKYPMMVYFYETYSDNRYNHYARRR
ncbi:MAG: S9 family peptidase [Bacteroidia bacterium]|nr:S9 family peptidase [Bacteroidia bacterium]